MNNYEVTWDDISDDIKELVRLGIYTKERVIEMCINAPSRYKEYEDYE